jgi:thiol-disulfide isomerase/thioredoxin
MITTPRPDSWRALSRVLTFCCVLAVAQPIVRLRAQDPTAAPAHPFFDNEPKRPKAAAPILFSKSWDDARAEAKRSGRRLVAYFTGDWCGWCRALEKRTFTDAEVVALAKQFVCVEIDIRNDKNLRLADEYQIDSIPRTYVFTPDGRVIDRRAGYLAATEFASWLKNVHTTPPAPVADVQKPKPPAPVGAGEEESDVVIWFVDATTGVDRWSDRDWTGHLQLLQVLHAAGLHPRVEHVARDDFPARWDSAAAANKAPDVISADNRGGLIKSLESLGRFLLVRSNRLSWMTDISSCPDFKGRWLFVVSDSWHAATGKIAVRELLRPGPETSLPGTEFPAITGRAEAVDVARRAVMGYVGGDAELLKQVASPSSPQLSRCTRPDVHRRGWVVETGPVELRGNHGVAFAKVEMRFEGKNMIGADPLLVVLRREQSHWKAFSVSSDVFSVKALPELARLNLLAQSTTARNAPPSPRLLYPDDGGRIREKGRSFAWEVPAGEIPLAAQICEVLLDDKDSSWPLSRLKVFPGEPRSRALLAAETDNDVTGIGSEHMRWCVWAIGVDGSVSSSAARSYRPLQFKY